MTDPVDTDALRTAVEVARPVIENAIGWAEHEGAGPDSDEQEAVSMTLAISRAAADEVERLRDRLHHVEHWTVPEAIRTWRKERSEAARLRAVIENAPHEQSCNLGLPGSYGTPLTCDCWKADAL